MVVPPTPPGVSPSLPSVQSLLGSSGAEGSSTAAVAAHSQLSRQLTAILSQLASQAPQQAPRPVQAQHLHPHQLAAQLAQQQVQQQHLHWQQQHHMLQSQAMSLDLPPAARQQAPPPPSGVQQGWGVPAALPQPSAQGWAEALRPPIKLEQNQEQQGRHAEASSPSAAAANTAQRQHWPGGSPGKPPVCVGEPGSLAQPGSAAAEIQAGMAAQQHGCQQPAMPAAQPGTRQAAQGSQPATSPAAPACASPLPALAEQGMRTLSSASGAQLLESVMKQLHQLTGARPGAQQAQQAPGPLPAGPSTEALLAALASARSRANAGGSAGSRE